MRTLTTVAVALAALALAGCGGDDTDTDDTDPPDDETTTSEAAPPPEGDGCGFLPLDAVAEALGTDVTEDAAGPTGCVFSAAAPSEVRVSVFYTPIAIDVETYAEGSRENCDDEVVEVDAGDIAFACTTFVAPQGVVYIGSDSVLVQVDDATDDATGVAAAAAMLPAVTIP